MGKMMPMKTSIGIILPRGEVSFTYRSQHFDLFLVIRATRRSLRGPGSLLVVLSRSGN
jgi:hypothetical protein